MAELGKYFETACLGRNRYQTTIGIKPANYQDGSTWKRISNNWADSSVGDRPHMVTTAPFMVSVAPDGDRRIHPTREEDVWFEMSGAKINQAGTWNKVALGTPTSRVNNRITWNRTNFNAYVDMAGHYVKLAYLLKNGYLPPNNQFAYEVATNGLTRAGGVFSKDGVPVMRMRKPVAYDYDNPDDIRQIAHEITRIDGKWHVVFTLPDLAGMSKPLIDPTLTLQPDAAAGQDAKLLYLTVANRAENYGASISWNFGKLNANWGSRTIWFMSLSSIDASATCNSATLILTNLASSGQTASVTLKQYEILAANTGWVEGTQNGTTEVGSCCWLDHTYNDQQEWAGSAGLSTADTDYNSSELASHSIGDDVEGTTYDITLDITQVQDWFGSDDDNHGVLGMATVEDTEGVYASLASSDNTTAAYRPKLVIVYSTGGTKTFGQWLGVDLGISGGIAKIIH